MENNNSKWIKVLLDLDREPIAVKFIESKEEYDSYEVDEPKRRMSYCTITRRVSKGEQFKFHRGHMACSGGATALGLEIQTEEMLSGERRFSQGAYNNLDICKKVSRDMKYKKKGVYGIIILSLEGFEKIEGINPDVVIFVCDSFNSMRIVQGYANMRGHAHNISLSGMQAICQEVTSLPYENNQLNMSLMCSGTRLLAGWNNDELAIGIPYHILDDVVKGLRDTVNPLERNKRKERIESKLKESNLESELEIVYNKNYDDNCYVGGLVGDPLSKK